jgi:prepilin-type N-terminal cleavage/methylation domain-containing protein
MKVIPKKNKAGFTLVEIMIVVAIIALLAAIAVPSFLRARKRSQATLILKQLHVLDDAQEQYAIDNSKSNSDNCYWTDLVPYLKAGTVLYTSCQNNLALDELGNPIPSDASIGGGNASGERDGVAVDTFNALSDVAPATFWSPFPIGTPP